jgi:hypothetical protein
LAFIRRGNFSKTFGLGQNSIKDIKRIEARYFEENQSSLFFFLE